MNHAWKKNVTRFSVLFFWIIQLKMRVEKICWNRNVHIYSNDYERFNFHANIVCESHKLKALQLQTPIAIAVAIWNCWPKCVLTWILNQSFYTRTIKKIITATVANINEMSFEIIWDASEVSTQKRKEIFIVVFFFFCLLPHKPNNNRIKRQWRAV